MKEFQACLTNKGVTTKHVGESLRQIGKMTKACKWQYIGDINAGSTLSFLGDLRRDGRSAQTYNGYRYIAEPIHLSIYPRPLDALRCDAASPQAEHGHEPSKSPLRIVGLGIIKANVLGAPGCDQFIFVFSAASGPAT